MYSLLLAVALLPSIVQCHRFFIMTSPTLGNFRDLSGLINGLLNFRHEVHFLAPDNTRAIPELPGTDRMQLVTYRTTNENPYDSQQYHELIYSQQESSLSALNTQISDYECQEAHAQSAEIIEKIKKLKIEVVVIDADFQCYYQIASELDLPFVSLASKSEPYLMQTHALNAHTCYIQESNNLYRRIKAFWSYINQRGSIATESALWLWNTNGIVDCPGSTTSNLLTVGGLSHKEEQALPEELDKTLTNSKFGVIVFSLPGIHYHEDILSKFFEAFDQLDQTIIWRTNANIKQTPPGNVLKTSLLSENDILAHVNVKLMITDGDNARQLDSLFHGVPLISIPLTSAQRYNADRVRIKGFGTSIELSTSADDLADSINQILNDVEVTEKAKKASELLKGSPDYRYIAVYWLDLIAKHGAEHLKPQSLTTVQFYMFDVLVVMCVFTVSTCYVVNKLGRSLVRKILNRRRRTVTVSDHVTPIPNSKEEKEKPKLEIPKPKAQPEPEMKSDTSEPESPPAGSGPNQEKLHHQGSKKHKKKKHR